MNQTYGMAGVTAVVLATVLVGALGLRIPMRSDWPSPSRPRPSARCSSSASGGAA
ncbi:hypothetical protein [Streptomyces sp. FXJ1.172]|uniref:hypothetical protein n=1 Tax=Streptomyces sp. FXJ1.172 TaxID=710705 RepID=UPI000AEA90A6